MARNMNTNMYCFCCNESSTLEQILLSADDFRLARGECKKNLCTLNDCFTITYCNNCELYSIAVEDRLINGIFIYKLKTTKEKPSVICFLDDTTEKNAKSKKQLSEAIKTVLKEHLVKLSFEKLSRFSKCVTNNQPNCPYSIVAAKRIHIFPLNTN